MADHGVDGPDAAGDGEDGFGEVDYGGALAVRAAVGGLIEGDDVEAGADERLDERGHLRGAAVPAVGEEHGGAFTPIPGGDAGEDFEAMSARDGGLCAPRGAEEAGGDPRGRAGGHHLETTKPGPHKETTGRAFFRAQRDTG